MGLRPPRSRGRALHGPPGKPRRRQVWVPGAQAFYPTRSLVGAGSVVREWLRSGSRGVRLEKNPGSSVRSHRAGFTLMLWEDEDAGSKTITSALSAQATSIRKSWHHRGTRQGLCWMCSHKGLLK